MLKIAFKNLWNRRIRYGCLFVELLVVTMLSWFVLDRLIVLNYQYNLPLGYDPDPLCVLWVENIHGLDPAFDREVYSTTLEDFWKLLAQVRGIDDVDCATPGLIGEQPISITYITPSGQNIISTQIFYYSGEDFFKVYDIKSPDGADNAQWLSDLEGPGVVMTRSLADYTYPGGNPFASNDSCIANFVPDPDNPWREPDKRLLAIVDDVRYSSTIADAVSVAFIPQNHDTRVETIVMRLKKGVDRDEFVSRVSAMLPELRFGNIRAKSVMSYADCQKEAQQRDSGTDRRMYTILGLFFLLNVCLGVTGTFWMMTRKRAPEVGLLRAYGYRAASVRLMLVAEALMVAFPAWLLGCLGYYYYLLSHQLYMGKAESAGFLTSWVDNFPVHFSIISAAVLLVVVIAVVVGVLGPAYLLGRVTPVEALRDE